LLQAVPAHRSTVAVTPTLSVAASHLDGFRLTDGFAVGVPGAVGGAVSGRESVVVLEMPE
jgi:hypothetical protein